MVPAMLSAISSLHSPEPRLFLSSHGCPFSHRDTNRFTSMVTVAAPTPGRPQLPVGEVPTKPILLHALDPFLNPTSTLLSVLLLPSCYLSCHRRQGRCVPCPQGWHSRVLLTSSELGCPRAAPRIGKAGVGPAGDAQCEPGVQNALPAFLQCQTSPRAAAPGWDSGWGAQPRPLAQLPQQHRVSGLSTQTRWTQIVFPFLTARGWQICGGERSGLTLSRLSIFLIQRFCCQPGILK